MRPTLVAFVLFVGCVDQAAPPATPAKAEETGHIRGQVRDPDGNPVAGASISVANGARTASDDYGLYLLVVPPGTYRVTVAAPTYESMQQAVEVEADMVYIRNWDLGRTAAQPTK
jgi:hypothetical protein